MDHIQPIVTISEQDVYRMMSMETCVDLMKDLFVQVAAGKSVQPLRTFVPYERLNCANCYIFVLYLTPLTPH